MTIRRARDEDVENILDLLTYYEVPRSYFEPFYLRDPSYRPEHSWVAEEEGRFVAHIRVFDRTIRAGEAGLRVAGIGSVITAPESRGRGLAGQLLRDVLAETPKEGFAYSLLRAYQPVLYERHGWASIQSDLVRATLPPDGAPPVERFTKGDLPEVMRLYESSNVARSGTTVRSPEYWRSQLEWLNEDREGFLVSRAENGTLAGYVRSRVGEAEAEILELGIRRCDAKTGRALLSAAAARSGGRLKAHLPSSLRTLFRPEESEVTSAFGLMGRVLDLAMLVEAVRPLWMRRVRESGGRGGSFNLATSVGHAEVRVRAEEVEVLRSARAPIHALGEGEFAHLLFRGFDSVATERLGARPDSDLLRTLFPKQDFVVWRADAF